jgi:hypothetical protein
MFTHACAEALTFFKKCYFGNFVLLKLFWPCKNQEHLLGLHGMFLHARAKTITFIEMSILVILYSQRLTGQCITPLKALRYVLHYQRDLNEYFGNIALWMPYQQT